MVKWIKTKWKAAIALVSLSLLFVWILFDNWRNRSAVRGNRGAMIENAREEGRRERLREEQETLDEDLDELVEQEREISEVHRREVVRISEMSPEELAEEWRKELDRDE